MLRELLEAAINEAINKAMLASKLGSLTSFEPVSVELPKNPEHGDRAVSACLRLSKEAKIPPRVLAEAIVSELDSSLFEKVEIAGPGFINLKLNWASLSRAIAEIHREAENYGKLNQRPDPSYSKILVEYVSANPTGDLHIGHGRQAAYGSALVSLLKWAAYEVDSEFYINDAGAQMMKLGESVKYSILIAEGLIAETNYPEAAYPLASMREFIKPAVYQRLLDSRDLAYLQSLSINQYAELGKTIFLAAQKTILSEISVVFDRWFSENTELYHQLGSNPPEASGTKVERVCDLLTQAGHTYVLDSALWFRAKDLGDERDRVLRKSDGYYTYLAGDLAYHYDKIQRGYDRLINIWGADHHGQEPSLIAALMALSQACPELKFHKEQLEIPLIQMVSLQKEGVEVKMSKRTGDLVTVRELAEEVGVDALRYFLIESQINNRMVFDLELATKQDKDNPVYYVQYAHARCCSIIRTLTGIQLNLGDARESHSLSQALLSRDEYEEICRDLKSDKDIFTESFSRLEGDSASSTRQLILALLHFPEEIAEAALARAPHKIANYLKLLAGLFHQFYTHNRVLVEDKSLLKARLSLVLATRRVLANALNLLAIKAPESM